MAFSDYSYSTQAESVEWNLLIFTYFIYFVFLSELLKQNLTFSYAIQHAMSLIQMESGVT